MGHKECVQLLLDKGAEVDLQGAEVDLQDEMSEVSQLIIACLVWSLGYSGSGLYAPQHIGCGQLCYYYCFVSFWLIIIKNTNMQRCIHAHYFCAYMLQCKY